jgi:vitamin B12 transporter
VDEGVFLEREIGSNDYCRTGASAFVARDDWGLSLGAATLTTDNERDNDDFENRSVTARFDYLLAEHLTFELLGNYSESEKGVPGSITAPTSLDEGDTESWLISPGLKYTTDDLTIHFFYSRGEFERDDFSSGQYGANSNAEVNTDEVSLQIDYTLTNGVLFTFGGLYRNDEIESVRAPLSGAPASNYDERYEQAGAFAQVLYRVTDNLEVRGGMRYDDFSDYKDSWTGNIEAIHTIESYDLSFFAKLSESFAPPTLLDVAYNPSSLTVNPEKSVSYELGLRQNLFNDLFEWTLVFFRNEIEEFIAYDFDTFTTYNIGEVTTEGVELGVDYSLTEKVGLGLGYTYLTAENNKTGDRLVRRPRHALQLSANYFITDNLSVGAVGIGYFDSKEVGNVDHGDSFVVNLVANCDINDTWSIFARAENVLDREYESVGGYPSLGRTGYIGARMKF